MAGPQEAPLECGSEESPLLVLSLVSYFLPCGSISTLSSQTPEGQEAFIFQKYEILAPQKNSFLALIPHSEGGGLTNSI